MSMVTYPSDISNIIPYITCDPGFEVPMANDGRPASPNATPPSSSPGESGS